MRILLLNQAFYPDVVATAQFAGDLAVRLVEAGHEVRVIASARGYDQPGTRFPKSETWEGVEIQRVPTLGLGKSALGYRLIDSGVFFALCLWKLLWQRPTDVVVALTTPPLIGALAALFACLRGSKLVYWVMDLNPDQAIAAGWLKRDSVPARWLERLLRFTLRHSTKVVVLDRFMRDRILAKGVPPERISIIPPWSRDNTIRYDRQGRLAFRAEHGLSDKFVVMYAGNHSPCHPLTIILEAARTLADRDDIAFCFVGGGSEHIKVRQFAEEHSLRNIVCLPYQLPETLSASLSAADLHVVVMGEPFVGIVHPCKVYNILALGSPMLYVGPANSHVTDLRALNSFGRWFYEARPGDLETVVSHVLAAVRTPRPEPTEQVAISAAFSQCTLTEQMLACIESSGPAVVAPPLRSRRAAAAGGK